MSVAKSSTSALGVTSRAVGYFEGGGRLISWCIGHQVGLADEAAYDDRYKLINACDVGREGELIFRLVYKADGCSKPLSRL